MIRKFILAILFTTLVLAVLSSCGYNSGYSEELSWRYEVFAFRGGHIKQYKAHEYEKINDNTLKIVWPNGEELTITADKFEIVKHVEPSKNE